MGSPTSPPVRRWRLFLKLTVALFSPVILFFGYCWLEDWEGARVLAATKAKWIARGESFDRNTFIPQAIPDEQNLGAIPLFNQTLDPLTGKLAPMTLLAATKKADLRIPMAGLSNLKNNYPETVRKAVLTAYVKEFPLGTVKDPIDQLDCIFPVWKEIVAQSQLRPDCRFILDNNKTLYQRSYSLTISQITLSKYGLYHGFLLLDKHESHKALENLTVMLKLGLAAGRDRTLISELVNIAIIYYCNNMLIFGESNHEWTADDLSILERDLSPVNQLENGKECFRGELVEGLETVTFLKANRSNKDLDPSNFFSSIPESATDFIKYWPNGWFDLNSSQRVDYMLESIQSIDPVRHRVDPAPVDAELAAISARLANWSACLPWNVLVVYDIPAVIKQNKTFARSQVLLDEAVISCVLERYYLKNHSYPKSLEQLVPEFAPTLPNDIFGGAPYKYVLKKDGTYLLYSIGWNEKDDGGKPSSYDKLETGDWVWPNNL